jgi:hypothetical protein
MLPSSYQIVDRRIEEFSSIEELEVLCRLSGGGSSSIVGIVQSR